MTALHIARIPEPEPLDAQRPNPFDTESLAGAFLLIQGLSVRAAIREVARAVWEKGVKAGRREDSDIVAAALRGQLERHIADEVEPLSLFVTCEVETLPKRVVLDLKADGKWACVLCAVRGGEAEYELEAQ